VYDECHCRFELEGKPRFMRSLQCALSVVADHFGDDLKLATRRVGAYAAACLGYRIAIPGSSCVSQSRMKVARLVRSEFARWLAI
jgi:hypothetical protein